LRECKRERDERVFGSGFWKDLLFILFFIFLTQKREKEEEKR